MQEMVVDYSRRKFLNGLGTAALTAMLGSTLGGLLAPAVLGAEQAIPLRLLNTNTGERYDVELFHGSAWNPNALVVCDYLMRDWRQGESVECDRKLYASLYVIQRYFAPSEPVHINSGYRTRETNELLRDLGYQPADNSQHLRAKAVDFTIPGANLRNVAKAVKALNIGGTGLYTSMGFVHMDSRGTPASWGF